MWSQKWELMTIIDNNCKAVKGRYEIEQSVGGKHNYLAISGRVLLMHFKVFFIREEFWRRKKGRMSLLTRRFCHRTTKGKSNVPFESLYCKPCLYQLSWDMIQRMYKPIFWIWSHLITKHAQRQRPINYRCWDGQDVDNQPLAFPELVPANQIALRTID